MKKPLALFIVVIGLSALGCNKDATQQADKQAESASDKKGVTNPRKLNEAGDKETASATDPLRVYNLPGRSNNGENAAHLHPGVQGGSGQARHRAGLLRRRSRTLTGQTMAEHRESRLVVDALEMAIQRRLPGEGLLSHSDRGSQYASQQNQHLPAKHGIVCSMSRRADCWANAPMESFFASLKKELVHDADFATRREAQAVVFEYIEVFYKGQRRHSSWGYVSPMEYEQSATP